VLCGRRREALEESAALLGHGERHLVLPADITLAEDRRRIAEAITTKSGRLDILVNNAGVVEGGPVEELDDEALARIFQTNAVAPIALARELMPLLDAARPARVVNIGSVFGDIPYAGFAAYSASKFALRGFSIALRREWKEHDIGVTYVAPRATRTDAAAAFAELITASKMRLDPPQKIARQIWAAVGRGESAFYAPGPERFYVLLQRLFPRLIDWALTRKSASASA
jgi:NAD(P)-dependent dehydrogenase (short-subunit alcohol dehydrogenase family)